MNDGTGTAQKWLIGLWLEDIRPCPLNGACPAGPFAGTCDEIPLRFSGSTGKKFEALSNGYSGMEVHHIREREWYLRDVTDQPLAAACLQILAPDTDTRHGELSIFLIVCIDSW